MKHLIASLTIGACLLLSSAGVAFATDPHKVLPGGTTGQSGTGSPTPVAGCGIVAPSAGAPDVQPSPPGQADNTHTNSPFPSAGPPPLPNYAGQGTGNYGAGTTGTRNPHANSQYDNACLQQAL